MDFNKTPLSTKDVIRIIVASAKAGVDELKFLDLCVSFNRPVEQEAIKPLMQQYPASVPVQSLTEEQHEFQTKAAIEAEEVLTREDQLARALVEDPIRYEQLLVDGELSDELDTADDGDGSDNSE